MVGVSKVGGNGEVVHVVFLFVAVLEFRALVALKGGSLTGHILDVEVFRIPPLLGNYLWLFFLELFLDKPIDQVIKCVGII